MVPGEGKGHVYAVQAVYVMAMNVVQVAMACVRIVHKTNAWMEECVAWMLMHV